MGNSCGVYPWLSGTDEGNENPPEATRKKTKNYKLNKQKKRERKRIHLIKYAGMCTRVYVFAYSHLQTCSREKAFEE